MNVLPQMFVCSFKLADTGLLPAYCILYVACIEVLICFCKYLEYYMLSNKSVFAGFCFSCMLPCVQNLLFKAALIFQFILFNSEICIYFFMKYNVAYLI